MLLKNTVQAKELGKYAIKNAYKEMYGSENPNTFKAANQFLFLYALSWGYKLSLKEKNQIITASYTLID